MGLVTKVLIGSIALCTVVVTVVSAAPQDKIVFLDVGQGDAILIQDDTQQVLIDGGPGAEVLAQLDHEMPTFDRTLEVLVLTHPQQDHLEGFLHILQKYKVGLVLFPNAAAKSELYQAFLQLLEEEHVPYRFAWAGETLSLHEARMTVLAPFDSDQARAIAKADINNASTTARLDFHELSMLFTGDAEQIAEQLLVTHIPNETLDVDVIKAGHHGSNSSTHAALLRATTPSAAVISVGTDNRFGHPHPALLERLQDIPIWRTDEQGAIRFLYNGSEWHLACVSC